MDNVLSDSYWLHGNGRNIWHFEFSVDGLTPQEVGASLGGSLVLSLNFEDGGSEVLGPSFKWPDSTDPSIAHRQSPIFEVGSFEAAGSKFLLLGQLTHDEWSLGVGGFIEGLSAPDGFNWATFTGSAEPGAAGSATAELFGVGAWASMGFGHIHGAGESPRGSHRHPLEDGRTARPSRKLPLRQWFPYRVFGAALSRPACVCGG